MIIKSKNSKLLIFEVEATRRNIPNAEASKVARVQMKVS